MIVALEGNDGVGKSTAAELIRRRLNLPVFADRVRHGLLGALSPREMFVAGNQCNLDLAALSRALHLVADRWVLSSVVYDGLRGIPIDAYEEVLPVCARASAWVFLLDLDPGLALERVVSRDGKPRRTLAEMQRIRAGFSAAAEIFRSLGGRVTVINVADPAWEKLLLTGVELALLHAGREG